MIADDLIAEIRERVDMVALVGEYVTLKKRGTNHVGLCPFHNEKTPSFNVRAEQKYYHCFGCKESGDPFSFLMRMEGLSFPQALRALAEKVGVEVPEAASGEEAVERRERDRRERLYALMDTAASFYVERLATPAAAAAQAELGRRGVGADVARAFRLGYAPDAWDALVRHLRPGGWSLDDAEAVGLVVRRRTEGHYDRFRHRLMFPISDLSGRVVAFSGRVLPSAETASRGEEPKYVNSPEGPLYRKGATLYGLHEGRVAVRRLGWALLCEGNFDLVALHQAGFDNAVAPLGTAFTEGQGKLLRRFAQSVTLLFDADAAGEKAVRAAFPVLRGQELRARVALLPAGEDPDSYLRRYGAEALRQLVDRASGIVEFLIDRAAEGAGEGAAERGAAVTSLGPILGMVDNSVERDYLIERIAQRFGIADLQSVRSTLRRRPAPASGRNVGAATGTDPGVAPQLRSARLPARQAELLGILLEHPTFFATSYAQDLEGLLASPSLREIFRAAANAQQNGALNPTELLSHAEGNPALPWLRERLALTKYQDGDHGEEALRKGMRLLAKENIERELPRLAREISDARRSGDTARADRLTREREELARSAHRQVQQPTR